MSVRASGLYAVAQKLMCVCEFEVALLACDSEPVYCIAYF